MLWILAALTPLLLAAVLTSTHRARSRATTGVTRWAVRLAPLALAPAGLLAVLGRPVDAAAPWVLLGTQVGLDVVSRALLLVAVLLYGAAVHAVSWRHDPRGPDLVAFLLVCFVGNAAVYVAADAVTFYLGFAVMSFAAAGLVLHDRTAQTRRAGRVYLTLTVGSESAILAALLLVVAAGGRILADAPAAVAASDARSVIVALLIVGFGVKAGLLPLHIWLPLAHPAAPPPASAVLSGAMVKAGLVGWLRFMPLGEVSMPVAGGTLTVLALLGAFAAVVAGVVQRDPKAVLAYSTISQMGFLGAVVGIALIEPVLAPACLTAAVIYAVHHGLAKGALFLGYGVWKHHVVPGAPVRRALVMAGMVLASLAVVGAPLSSGSVGKYAAKEAISGVTVLGVEPYDLLPLVATGSTILLVRFLWLLLGLDRDERDVSEDPELPAWLVLVVTSATVPWVLTRAWVPLADVPELEPVTVWDATWPILLGLALSVPVWLLAARGRLGTVPDRLGDLVPAGDLVVPAESAARGLGRSATALTGGIGAVRDGVLARSGSVGERLSAATERVRSLADEGLARWTWSGVSILVVLLLVLVLALTGGM